MRQATSPEVPKPRVPKAVRGLLITQELKITQKFPKIEIVNYQLPISALVLSAVE